MHTKVITPPWSQPISLEEARLHLKQGSSADDMLVSGAIASACRTAEHLTNRCFVAQRLRQTIDAFPCGPIKLLKGPLLRIVSIKWVDSLGATQTLDPVDYVADVDDEPTRIALINGSWPTARCQPAAVSVVYDAGYAAPLVIDQASHTISPRGWPELQPGAVLRLSNSGGALPAPLQPDTDYFVQSVPSAGVYTLSHTDGGMAIEFGDVGTGQSFIGDVPAEAKTWMKARLGSIDVYRQESADTPLQSLPFIDRLLDGLKVY